MHIYALTKVTKKIIYNFSLIKFCLHKEFFVEQKVPLLDLKAQYRKIQDKIEPAVLEILRNQTCILGEPVKSFEEAVAKYCQAKYAIGVSSGTDALLVAMMAINIQPGDEVITSDYSFFSTAGSIARLGAKAVFVDIDPITFNLNPEQIEHVITPKTKAIMPVHLFGQAALMDAISDIARRHKLIVIEDAAQALGSMYHNKFAGVLSDMGCFSFYPSKNLGGIGDGGMVLTNDSQLYDKIVKLRNHGCTRQYFHEMIGGNFRLDAIQAAALKVKLQFLTEWCQARIQNAADYTRLFQQSSLSNIVTLPTALPNHFHIYNQFVIRVPQRDALRNFLTEKGIGTAVYYPLPLHRQPCFQYWGYKEEEFPESNSAAANTLALPIYPELTMEQKTYVVDAVRNFYNK